MEIPDFTNLNLTAVISTLLFFAAIDTASAWVIALMNGNFTSAYALDFLRTHILKIGTPIALLAIVGHGVPPLGVPAVAPAGIAATAALAVYALTTIVSIKDSFGDKAIAPTATTNISPIVEPPKTIAAPAT
jgi:hypothetical protein